MKLEKLDELRQANVLVYVMA